MWQRKKLELESVLLKYSPDIVVISEANLKAELTDLEKDVDGYSLHFPKTMQVQNIARLVLLVREGIQVKILEDLMDTSVCSVWIKIGARGRKPLILAGIYR